MGLGATDSGYLRRRDRRSRSPAEPVRSGQRDEALQHFSTAPSRCAITGPVWGPPSGDPVLRMVSWARRMRGGFTRPGVRTPLAEVWGVPPRQYPPTDLGLAEACAKGSGTPGPPNPYRRRLGSPPVLPVVSPFGVVPGARRRPEARARPCCTGPSQAASCSSTVGSQGSAGAASQVHHRIRRTGSSFGVPQSWWRVSPAGGCASMRPLRVPAAVTRRPTPSGRRAQKPPR